VDQPNHQIFSHLQENLFDGVLCNLIGDRVDQCFILLLDQAKRLAPTCQKLVTLLRLDFLQHQQPSVTFVLECGFGGDTGSI